uniref:Uncharacterized protein n=1 Tax=Chromera velia CCMP2878 TaxID=1169474 RepID=A0A0G4HX18_9ALVE|eukprot:Cvel_9181.t1-p1 / transcript=Cvel_9181.t1 / gene=Cvel_9181 / organism=Chromera_velia_CCMP2878 / gene_product=hypothetical protein / transcript_product=hypothetical protein / location=Cvel_scaffold523:24892-31142(-) / protein_length=547 / sequence_SO=supercontig / SO=protein_coding / is_pseudo=false
MRTILVLGAALCLVHSSSGSGTVPLPPPPSSGEASEAPEVSTPSSQIETSPSSSSSLLLSFSGFLSKTVQADDGNVCHTQRLINSFFNPNTKISPAREFGLKLCRDRNGERSCCNAETESLFNSVLRQTAGSFQQMQENAVRNVKGREEEWMEKQQKAAEKMVIRLPKDAPHELRLLDLQYRTAVDDLIIEKESLKSAMASPSYRQCALTAMEEYELEYCRACNTSATTELVRSQRQWRSMPEKATRRVSKQCAEALKAVAARLEAVEVVVDDLERRLVRAASPPSPSPSVASASASSDPSDPLTASTFPPSLSLLTGPCVELQRLCLREGEPEEGEGEREPVGGKPEAYTGGKRAKEPCGGTDHLLEKLFGSACRLVLRLSEESERAASQALSLAGGSGNAKQALHKGQENQEEEDFVEIPVEVSDGRVETVKVDSSYGRIFAIAKERREQEGKTGLRDVGLEFGSLILGLRSLSPRQPEGPEVQQQSDSKKNAASRNFFGALSPRLGSGAAVCRASESEGGDVCFFPVDDGTDGSRVSGWVGFGG